MMFLNSRLIVCAIWVVAVSTPVLASDVLTSAPAAFDRWMYPFNATNGTRENAPLFGALGGGPVFDNRDGELILGFDTAIMGIETGKSYVIHSATVQVTHSTGGFNYDPTYDGYQTYLPSELPNPAYVDEGTTPGVPPTIPNPEFVVDSDPEGRPIELHGLGFRGAYIAGQFSGFAPSPPFFKETDAFVFGDPTAKGVRHAYPLGFDDLGNPIDVANNIDDGFESNPWAVGQSTSGLGLGDPVPQTDLIVTGETFEFEIDLSDPFILAYLEEGLEHGGLFFAVTALHQTGQGEGAGPNFFTSNSFHPNALSPTILLDVSVIPEPASLGLMGLGVLAGLRRRRTLRAE